MNDNYKNILLKKKTEELIYKFSMLWLNVITSDKISDDKSYEIEREAMLRNLLFKCDGVLSEENIDRIFNEENVEKVAEYMVISIRNYLNRLKFIKLRENIIEFENELNRIERILSLMNILYHKVFK